MKPFEVLGQQQAQKVSITYRSLNSYSPKQRLQAYIRALARLMPDDLPLTDGNAIELASFWR